MSSRKKTPAKKSKTTRPAKKRAPSKKARGRGRVYRTGESSEQGLQIPATSLAYLGALLTSGLFEGALGNQQVVGDVASLFTALHKVLAGGSLEQAISVSGPIDDATVAQLEALLAAAVMEINELNSRGGINVFFG